MWRRNIVSWSLYDFANTIFSMNIISLYLKRYIVEDMGKPDSYFDVPYAISMVLAAVLLPALGALSDKSAKKKLFVLLFTLTCCFATGLMALVPLGMLLPLIILFVVANFAYEAGMPFYNALLYSVAEGKRARLVSGFGVALGYVGSVVGMVVVMPFVSGSVFSLDIPFLDGAGKAGSFLPTAFLFLLFSIPLFLWVKERPVVSKAGAGLAAAYKDVWEGVRQTKKYPGVLRFLIADYFFEDAVTTVIINIGLYCSLVIGMGDGQTTLFLIVSTVSAVAGSFVIGKIAQVWSLKNLLTVIVWGWALGLLMFVVTDNMATVWVLGSVVGILLGGLWTTSRPMLGELVPRDELGRFFGLFSLSGRAAAVVGPLVWTITVILFHADGIAGRMVVELFNLSERDAEKLPYKVAILSLVLMMMIGLYIFRKVPHTSRNNDE